MNLFSANHLAIIGAGAVGTGLGQLLYRAGFEVVGVVSRRLASAQKLAARFKNCPAADHPEAICGLAEMVMLCVPDPAIQIVCEDMAKKGCFRAGMYVFHTSGLHSSALLQAAAAHGVHCFSFHPLLPFSADADVQLPATFFAAVEGDPAGTAAGRHIAERIGATAFSVDAAQKNLYHTGAVMASNYLVTLFALASQVMAAAGVEARLIPEILTPLMQQTLYNVSRQGLAGLTGPIKRGDAETVALHVAALREFLPELIEIYRKLGWHTLQLTNHPSDRFHALYERDFCNDGYCSKSVGIAKPCEG